MSLKFRIAGLTLVVALAMSAIAVVNASATSTGHFIIHAETENGWVTGFEGGTHFTEFTSHGLEGGTVCDEGSFKGTTAKTSTHIDISPAYNRCHTTGAAAGTTVVDVNGCSYTFTPGHLGTMHVDCSAGKGIEITHPNCTIRITPQTPHGGVIYTSATEGGKTIITVDLNTIEFTTEYEAGICIFTGTNHTATLHGSITIKGYNDIAPIPPQEGAQVDITHTAT